MLPPRFNLVHVSLRSNSASSLPRFNSVHSTCFWGLTNPKATQDWNPKIGTVSPSVINNSVITDRSLYLMGTWATPKCLTTEPPNALNTVFDSTNLGLSVIFLQVRNGIEFVSAPVSTFILIWDPLISNVSYQALSPVVVSRLVLPTVRYTGPMKNSSDDSVSSPLSWSCFTSTAWTRLLRQHTWKWFLPEHFRQVLPQAGHTFGRSSPWTKLQRRHRRPPLLESELDLLACLRCPFSCRPWACWTGFDKTEQVAPRLTELTWTERTDFVMETNSWWVTSAALHIWMVLFRSTSVSRSKRSFNRLSVRVKIILSLIIFSSSWKSHVLAMVLKTVKIHQTFGDLHVYSPKTGSD